jgi:hypothetical protein
MRKTVHLRIRITEEQSKKLEGILKNHSLEKFTKSDLIRQWIEENWPYGVVWPIMLMNYLKTPSGGCIRGFWMIMGDYIPERVLS